ncbi:MAG: HlyD family secretion protein [Candidatus Krumholzibacteriia bacterium]
MKKKWIGLTVILVAGLGFVVAGWLNWKHGRLYPSTADAYVGGDVTTVASRVPGTLLAVDVQSHETVVQGQVVAELDPRDFDQAVSEAQAELAKAEATLEQDRALIAGAQAQIVVARSQAELARVDRDRYADLKRNGSIPERQAEQAATNSEVAAAQLTAAQRALTAAQARLLVDERNRTQVAAKGERAALQRSYCTVVAPCAGVVADKSAQPGQVVAAGQPLCRIAALAAGHVWVEANFKETQLGRIRAGQPATVTVHAEGKREYHGRVEAISAGTGSSFSLLPAENATGNWVEIVQRVPVRIVLDDAESPAQSLRLGLSAHVTIDTRGAGDR